jgi:hypothetical protein
MPLVFLEGVETSFSTLPFQSTSHAIREILCLFKSEGLWIGEQKLSDPSQERRSGAVADQGSGFLSVLDPSGSSVRYATLLGCGCEAIVLDNNGAAYLTGYADYSMPATPGAAQTERSEYDKGIIIKIDLTAASSGGTSTRTGGKPALHRASTIRKRSLRPGAARH